MPRLTGLKLDKEGGITAEQMPFALSSQSKVSFEKTLNFNLTGNEADRQLDLDEKNQKEGGGGPNYIRDWELQLGFGPFLPSAGSSLSKNYGSPSGGNFGFGVKATDFFSVLLVFDGCSYNATAGAPPNGSASFNNGNLELVGKLRLATKVFRPYLYAGPGLGFNNYNLQFNYNGLPSSSNYDETDFMAEGGAGMEIQLIPGINFFVQGGVVYNLTSRNFNNYGVDSPLVTYPILGGISLGR
jgi:hypothetical protein